MITKDPHTFFAPELFISNGVKDISFYKNAFGATEQLRFNNSDGSLHVVELSINGSIFHLHEMSADKYLRSPGMNNSTTVCIGLFVQNVDEVMKRAIEAGAIEISVAKDYEYGYRQGILKDPFGHYWQIQKKIG